MEDVSFKDMLKADVMDALQEEADTFHRGEDWLVQAKAAAGRCIGAHAEHAEERYRKAVEDIVDSVLEDVHNDSS